MRTKITTNPMPKNKRSVYMPEEMRAEIQQEADRLNQSVSWVLRQAWVLAKTKVKLIEDPTEVVRREYEG